MKLPADQHSLNIPSRNNCFKFSSSLLYNFQFYKSQWNESERKTSLDGFTELAFCTKQLEMWECCMRLALSDDCWVENWKEWLTEAKWPAVIFLGKAARCSVGRSVVVVWIYLFIKRDFSAAFHPLSICNTAAHFHAPGHIVKYRGGSVCVHIPDQCQQVQKINSYI